MIEALLRAVKAIESRLDRIETRSGGGRWIDWTPTVTQGAAVSVTVTEARYCVIGQVCTVYAHLTCTSAGTAGQAVVIGGLPAAAQMAFVSGVELVVGVARVFDSGTTNYKGGLIGASSSSFKILINQNGNVLGVGPAYTVANTDVISVTATYRVA